MPQCGILKLLGWHIVPDAAKKQFHGTAASAGDMQGLENQTQMQNAFTQQPICLK
jgi:hypothetical protein